MSSRAQAAQWFSEAIRLHKAGRLAEAEALYRRVLQRDSRHLDAVHYLGLLAAETGRLADALELMQRSVMLAPAVPHYQSNLAETLRRMGEFEAAVEPARRAVQLDPRSPESLYNLGVVLRDAGNDVEAIKLFLRTIELNPRHHKAYSNAGVVLTKLGKLKEALEVYNRGVAATGESQEMLSNWAIALLEAGRPRDAMEKARRAVASAADNPIALCNLGRCAGNWFDLDLAAESFHRALELKPDYALAHSNLLFVMLHHPRFSDREIFEAHADWGHRHAGATGAGTPLAEIVPGDFDRRLRIGYVSPDLREHPVTFFIEPVLAHHDPGQVEVFCYDNAPPAQADEVTARLRGYGANWRQVSSLPDTRLGKLIRDDRIDVLVDLAGHTANHRLAVFGHRPAPVQASYLGYQGTSGVAAIGYRLTDALVDPPGLTDAFHTEQLVRLDVFACYRPPAFAPEVAPAPYTQDHPHKGAKRPGLTFGAYTKIEKVSDPTLDLWAEVLHRVPDARLLVFAAAFDEPMIAELLHSKLESRGIARGRAETVGRQPIGAYLQSHERVDVILDTTPFNGHTTTCHALWMGVPTITLSGTRYASRMGLAVMSHIGLGEFAAGTPDEYVRIATDLAARPQRLSELRAGMRDRMRGSILMDEVRFTRRLEATIRELWVRQGSPGAR